MNKLYLNTTIIFIIFLILGVIVNYSLFKEHEKELYEISNKIVANVINKYPELEGEIIDIITTDIDSSEILRKYGIDEYRDFNYLKENNQYQEKLIYYNLSFILIFVISIYLFINYNNYKLSKEVYKINKYMNKVLSGNYSIDIRDYQENNLSLLKNDIYKLVVRLKEQNNKELKEKLYLKDFLSDISHQLKTPLTSMYVINDILEKEKDSFKRAEFLNKNREQLERIEWLITNLLKMSLLDSGTTQLIKKEVNVSYLINKSIEPINIKLELKNIKVNIIGDTDITHNLDLNWMTESLLNILKNACDYTKIAGTINIYYETNPLYLMMKNAKN